MGYAFISYSTKNQASADAMRELFNKHNIDTWMAPYDIPAGSEYAEVLYDALTGCACLVLMLTDISQNSQWVKKEVNIAITNGKTVIPVKLEDVELNSSMKLYLNDQQIVPVHVIEENSDEIQKVLNSVISLTGETKKNNVSEKAPRSPEQNINPSPKKVELTVWSPVNTDVYLNDKRHLVMKIDHNTGFDYKYNSINVSGEFELIFVSKGFEKVVAFDASSLDDKLEYRLSAILNKKEISLSYDRDEAIEQIKEDATAYAYNQLSKVGIAEDIPLLLEELNRLSSIESKDHHTNYLIATCASSLGELAIKFSMIEKVKSIIQVYENYEAKSSYGYMFAPIVKKIIDGGFSIETDNSLTGAGITSLNDENSGQGDTSVIQKINSVDSDSVDEIVLTAEQQTRLQSCACEYCGLSAQIKKDGNGYWVQCSHCDAVATIAESVDVALDNWVSSMKEGTVVVEESSTLDEANGISAKIQETSHLDETNNGIARNDENGKQGSNTVENITLGTVLGESNTASKPKAKGHLVSSYRRAIVISKEDCVHPIEILMPDDTTKTFDFCDEFAVSNQKKYIVVRQMNDSDEFLFFIFRSRNGKNTLISEGQDQKKVYRWFREKHTDEYVFTDEKAAVRTEKKKKHFAQDTAPRLFATSDDIPQILVLPDKYVHISANAFAKLNLNGKEIRQIIISDSVEVIEDNAFEGLIVTEAVHIPSSVKKIGDSAFTLKEGAYIYFSSLSRTSIAYPRQNAIVITDAPYKRTVDYEVEAILAEIAQSKNITRIKHQVLPCRYPSPVVEEIVIPDGVCVIDNSAFDNVKVSKRVVIPSSVTRIGQYSFELLPDAYVECDANSYAYLFCQENGIRNSVDISNYYRAKGVCAYCGGRFSGLFKKKCSLCGKEKDY